MMFKVSSNPNHCVISLVFPLCHFTAIPNDCISLRIRSPMCQTPGKGWEFIQGPGLSLVFVLSVLLRGFLCSLNRSRLIGFYTGTSRSCFLPLFVWTRASNSQGGFQTAQSVLTLLQTSSSRRTESIKANSKRRGFVMASSYLHSACWAAGGEQAASRMEKGQ